MIKNICIITDHFPSGNDATYSFVEQIVFAMVNEGVNVVVISPICIISNKKNKRAIRPRKEIRSTSNGKSFIVYSPRIISVSNIPLLSNFINRFVFNYSVYKIIKILKSLSFKIDAIYGHFILNGGLLAAKVGERLEIPSFVACGESNITKSISRYNITFLKESLKNVKGVIAVSTEIKNKLIDLEVFKTKKIGVFPNGVDKNLFHFNIEIRKQQREKFGITADDFVIIFVGYFVDRKGPLRVLEAIKDCENIKLIFIGKGPQKLVSEKIIFCESINHEDLPNYLNCADVFVLPTYAEGCCNAIIEAMACGLPIISSNLAFNDDILFIDNSIRINPQNIEEIRTAILRLQNDSKLCFEMGIKSLEHSMLLSIDNRAKQIIKFINECLL